ncbi:unnamed protein product, partial [Thlaspi arvense]
EPDANLRRDDILKPRRTMHKSLSISGPVILKINQCFFTFLSAMRSIVSLFITMTYSTIKKISSDDEENAEIKSKSQSKQTEDPTLSESEQTNRGSNFL